MENLSRVLYENKRAQSSVQAKSSCIVIEQVNGGTIADLSLDFYAMMKKPMLWFPHCRWEAMYYLFLDEAF